LSSQTGFVGREAEAVGLHNLIDRALDGQGAVAMLGGGPGVGKTRLATEAVAYAESKGFRAFVGHCYERDEPYPYLPFAEIFETMLAQAGKDRFRAGLGDNAAELAQIAPRMRRIFPDISVPTELPPQQARRYLFQSLTEYLARIATATPLLLVLDDLHWADESTLALLNFLAHRVAPMRLVVIGTYRDGEARTEPALARTLEELLRIGVRPLVLRGLSHDAVANMLRELTQREPPQSLVRLIFTETDGNPFFVEEVYKHLAEEGKVFDEAGNFRTDFQIEEIDVPSNVKLVLGRRLDRLSAGSRRILTAAAVIGQGFSFEPLQRLAGARDADEVLAGIEEAQRMGLVAAPSGDLEAPFVFVHELVRQTLLADISPPRRQRLHLGAADAIEALYPQEKGARAAAIAHHLVSAGPLADRSRAARYLALSAKNALAAAAYEEARRDLGAAAALGDSGDRAARAQQLLDMATADRGLGNWDEAFALWNEAVNLYSALGDSEATGCVFFEMFEGLLWSGRGREATELAQRGLDGLKEDPANRAYLAAVMGLINSLDGRYEPARQSFGEALSMAGALRDRRLIARIRAYCSICNFYFMQVKDALENGRKSAELAEAVDAPWSRAIGLSRMQVALHHMGRIEEGAAVGRELEPLARKLGHFAALSFYIWTEAWTEFGRDADFARLRARLAEDLEFSRTVKIPLLLAPALAQLSVIEFLRGNREAAVDYADQAMNLSPFPVMQGFGRGAKFRQMAYASDRSGALELLEQARFKLPRPGAANTIGSWAMLLAVVEGLFILGEMRAAADFYPLVRELISTGTVCMGWIARFPQTIAAIAATAARNWSAAQEHFAIALRQAKEFPHRLEIAEVNRFRAMMLIERKESGDLDKAGQMLAQALDTYQQIGMPRHAELTRALVASLSVSSATFSRV
jgi:tetratricopeptide (TPR) repeat protein